MDLHLWNKFFKKKTGFKKLTKISFVRDNIRWLIGREAKYVENIVPFSFMVFSFQYIQLPFQEWIPRQIDSLLKKKKKRQTYFIVENFKCKNKGPEKMAPFSDVSDGFVHVGNEH